MTSSTFDQPTPAAADARLQPLDPVAEQALEDLAVQRVLGREVVQQARPADADAGGDVVQRGALVAVLAEAVQRLGEDQVARRQPPHRPCSPMHGHPSRVPYRPVGRACYAGARAAHAPRRVRRRPRRHAAGQRLHHGVPPPLPVAPGAHHARAGPARCSASWCGSPPGSGPASGWPCTASTTRSPTSRATRTRRCCSAGGTCRCATSRCTAPRRATRRRWPSTPRTSPRTSSTACSSTTPCSASPSASRSCALVLGPVAGLLAAFIHINLLLGSNAAVNAIGHHFGRRPYANGAGNLQWLAFITAGEGLHNNHHAAPTSAKLVPPLVRDRPGLVGDQDRCRVRAGQGAPQRTAPQGPRRRRRDEGRAGRDDGQAGGDDGQAGGLQRSPRRVRPRPTPQRARWVEAVTKPVNPAGMQA